jgi:hypothetical protein
MASLPGVVVDYVHSVRDRPQPFGDDWREVAQATRP